MTARTDADELILPLCAALLRFEKQGRFEELENSAARLVAAMDDYGLALVPRGYLFPFEELSGIEQIQQFIWGMQVLHGTWADRMAPRGFVPPLSLARDHLRRGGMAP